MMFSFLAGAVMGYILCFVTSHDNHPKSIKRKLPKLKYKNIEFSPNMRIHFKSHQIHFHHWINLSILYISTLIYPADAFSMHASFQGFILGGVTQGLTYKDRFRIITRIQ